MRTRENATRPCIFAEVGITRKPRYERFITRFITVLICAWELRQQVVDQLASVSEHWLGCVTCVTHVVVALLEADQLQPQQPASPRGGDKMGREEKRREAKRREEKRREDETRRDETRGAKMFQYTRWADTTRHNVTRREV